VKKDSTNENMAGKMIRPLRAAVVVGLTLGALMAGGCQTPRERPMPYDAGSPPDMNVKLQPGDLIEAKFYYSPELNESQRVRPDGKIALQLIGEIEAAGKDPQQLQAELREKYTGLIEKPEVAVLVREMSNRAVFVGGAVRNPGRIPMTGNLTALAAILEAGGFDMTQAGFNRVVVIRQEEDQPKSYILDYAKTLKGEPGEPFYLHSQDLVIVPRTPITDIDQWIDQYLNRIVPQFGFTYTRPIGDGVIGIDTSRR
jgi:protein involved in polysaccharide export with SLBB domain